MNVYKVGLDIGSTTTKMVVLDKDGTTVLFSGYKRHQAKIQECLLGFLYQIKEQLGDIPLSFHITGSVGMEIAPAEPGLSLTRWLFCLESPSTN